jgi:hypothetical protein
MFNRANFRVETVTEEVLATPRSSRDGMVSPRPSLSGPAVEHLAVQVRIDTWRAAGLTNCTQGLSQFDQRKPKQRSVHVAAFTAVLYTCWSSSQYTRLHPRRRT